MYRGVFGSHVANVLRRLRRLARAYGTEPRFLLTSATIANPVELAERLTGRRRRAGRPRRRAARRAPDRDVEPAARGRAARQARRRRCPRPPALLAAARRARGAHDLLPQVAPRRRADPALHAPAARGRRPRRPRRADRALPRRLHAARSGARSSAGWPRASCSAVVATDALELGIDIGDLDAAICVTFPGTVASLRQMWGRAGRRATGLALYVAGEDALDQFFCRHPDEFLERPVESAILDHESEEIHLAHLIAAAYELPLSARGRRHARPALGGARRAAREARAACASAAAATCRAARATRPRDIALRSASPDSVAIVEAEGGELIGTVETARAALGGPPGRRSTCTWARLRGRGPRPARPPRARAAVRRRLVHAAEEGDRDLHRAGARRRARRGGVALSFGIVSVTEQVVAYQRKRVGRPRGARPAGRRPARAGLRHPGALVRAARARSLRARLPARRAPGLAARRRARADRGAAADRDVRPLGHRRPLDRLPPPDRPADDLHLRRPSRRRRHHARGLRALRARWSATRCG